MTARELSMMKSESIRDCDTARLIDLRTVAVNPALPLGERFSSFLEGVKNPYLFKVDDISVGVRYVGQQPLIKALADAFQ